MSTATVNRLLLVCALIAGLPAVAYAASDARDVEALADVRELVQSDRDAALARLDELLAAGNGGTLSPRQRAEALAMRGGLLRSASRYESAEADAEAMLALAEDIGDPALASRALHLAGRGRRDHVAVVRLAHAHVHPYQQQHDDKADERRDRMVEDDWHGPGAPLRAGSD